MGTPKPQSKAPRRRITVGKARADLARAEAEEWAWKALHKMLRFIVEMLIRGERL